MAFGSALRENLAALRGTLGRTFRGAERQRNFYLHLHPPRVTERSLRFATTFGLGITTLTLSLLLAVTGALLMLYYSPTPDSAYASMLDIEQVVAFGAFTRRMHRFAAHALVVVVALHLLRVVATAAYRGRELNWWIGLGLFGLMLGLAFSGYLLVWDQTAYWAVQVAANLLDNLPLIGAHLKILLLGGDQVGAASLLRFYTLHVALLPGLLLAGVVWHLWRIRRDDGLARPAAANSAQVSAWPHLVLREVILALTVIGLIGILTLFLDASLGPPADPLHPANPEKAPWYFVGFQELVSYSALTGGFLFPAALALGLSLLPLLDREDEGIGVWLGNAADRGWLVVSVIVAALGFGLTEVAFLWPGAQATHVHWPGWLQDLINPAGLGMLIALLSFALIGQRSGRTRPALRAALVVLMVFLLGATLIGIARGPDWILEWPWAQAGQLG